MSIPRIPLAIALLLLAGALAAIPFLAFPGADLLALISEPRAMHALPDGRVVHDASANLSSLFKGLLVVGCWLGSIAALFSSARIAIAPAPRRLPSR